jgi:hypothetical protein
MVQFRASVKAALNAALTIASQASIDWQSPRIYAVVQKDVVRQPIVVTLALAANDSDLSMAVCRLNALKNPVMILKTLLSSVVVLVAWAIHVPTADKSLHVPTPGSNGLLTCAG